MPTYKRQNQRAVLVIQTQVFSTAKGIHLLLAEDSIKKTPWINNLLQKSQIPFSHLTCGNRPSKNCTRFCARGWTVRNCALEWLNKTGIEHGVIYFADDDNFYDVRLFDEVRTVRYTCN